MKTAELALCTAGLAIGCGLAASQFRAPLQQAMECVAERVRFSSAAVVGEGCDRASAPAATSEGMVASGLASIPRREAPVSSPQMSLRRRLSSSAQGIGTLPSGQDTSSSAVTVAGGGTVAAAARAAKSAPAGLPSAANDKHSGRARSGGLPKHHQLRHGVPRGGPPTPSLGTTSATSRLAGLALKVGSGLFGALLTAGELLVGDTPLRGQALEVGGWKVLLTPQANGPAVIADWSRPTCYLGFVCASSERRREVLVPDGQTGFYYNEKDSAKKPVLYQRDRSRPLAADLLALAAMSKAPAVWRGNGDVFVPDPDAAQAKKAKPQDPIRVAYAEANGECTEIWQQENNYQLRQGSCGSLPPLAMANWVSPPDVRLTGPQASAGPGSAGVANGASEGDKKCFVAGTLVHTAQGMRAIETLRAGDVVWARNEASGVLAAKPVVRTFERADRPVVRVTFAGTAGPEIVGVTPEHPFFVSRRGWVGAGSLQPGDELQTMDGASQLVVAVEDRGERETVHNLEVADTHTYFVGRGAAWVHNECDGVPALSPPGGPSLGRDELLAVEDALEAARIPRPNRKETLQRALKDVGIDVVPVDAAAPSRLDYVISAAPGHFGRFLEEWREATQGAGRVVLSASGTPASGERLTPLDVVLTGREFFDALRDTRGALATAGGQYVSRTRAPNDPTSPADLLFTFGNNPMLPMTVMQDLQWLQQSRPSADPEIRRRTESLATLLYAMGVGARSMADRIPKLSPEAFESMVRVVPLSDGRSDVTLELPNLGIQYTSPQAQWLDGLHRAGAYYMQASLEALRLNVQTIDPTISPSQNRDLSESPNSLADVLAAVPTMRNLGLARMPDGSQVWVLGANPQGPGAANYYLQIDTRVIGRIPGRVEAVHHAFNDDVGSRTTGLYQRTTAREVPGSEGGVVVVEVPRGLLTVDQLTPEQQAQLVSSIPGTVPTLGGVPLQESYAGNAAARFQAAMDIFATVDPLRTRRPDLRNVLYSPELASAALLPWEFSVPFRGSETVPATPPPERSRLH